MKTWTLLGAMAVWIIASGAGFARIPHQVGGFELGKKISTYTHQVDMDTAFPIRYREFLHQVEIRETQGFKSGLITFGTCADPGRIVQIKLKYAVSSKRFFEDLLARYKERFGEPAEYRGDSFQVFIAWKWSFVDTDGHRISLTLQHNQRDEEEKMGNSVKMTMTDLMDEERRCDDQKRLEIQPDHQKQKKQQMKKELDIDLLIPR